MVASLRRRVKSTPPMQRRHHQSEDGFLAAALGRIKQRAHETHQFKNRWEAMTAVPSGWQWPQEKNQ